MPTIWPSPESLRTFPRAVGDLLPQARYAVLWLHKTVHDLKLLDADPRVVLVQAPPRAFERRASGCSLIRPTKEDGGNRPADGVVTTTSGSGSV